MPSLFRPRSVVGRSGMGGGSGGVSPEEKIQREVKSLLNKLTIEKYNTITEKIAVIAASVAKGERSGGGSAGSGGGSVVGSTDSVSLMKVFVSLVLRKAVTEADWSEMYADVCMVLRWRTVMIVGENRDRIGSAFGPEFVNQIGDEFASLPKTMKLPEEETVGLSPEEITQKAKKQLGRISGVVKLIGELFYRGVLRHVIINQVASDLVFSDSPEEHFVACFCHLVSTVGYFMDNSGGNYQSMLDSWMGRLSELQKKKRYSKRLVCLIQDLMDCRSIGWLKKVHKERAKALGDLREQFGREEDAGGSAIAAQYGQVVVMGSRANMEANGQYAQYMKDQEARYKKQCSILQEQIAQRQK
eukprot:GHVQ01025546.1.p1 GENE.GHVQ01025546.1~~GHVQ01025546.1.p1  ORF type:complete len:358 (-),score=73.37 GHVQ01025546.1:390-1463(-)